MSGFYTGMKIPQTKFVIKSPELKKVEWKNCDFNDERKMFDTFSLQHNIFGNLNVSIRKYEDGFNRWIIEIKNSLNKLFGQEILSMEKETKNMIGYNIVVEPEYRYQGHRFGELLRLFSVMEMNENKAKQLKIFSKGSAVYFHSKYKFVPCNIKFFDRDMALEAMSKDSSENFADLKQRAKEISDAVLKNKSDSAKQRELCRQTNTLTKEYIKRALQEPDASSKHAFDYGMDMVLTREEILENKDFFNNLFKKYNIDYSI